MDIMGAASLSMGMARTNLMQDIGTAVLAKSMDQMQMASSSLTEMIDTAAMERSVCPELGGNIDICV